MHEVDKAPGKPVRLRRKTKVRERLHSSRTLGTVNSFPEQES